MLSFLTGSLDWPFPLRVLAETNSGEITHGILSVSVSSQKAQSSENS